MAEEQAGDSVVKLNSFRNVAALFADAKNEDYTIRWETRKLGLHIVPISMGNNAAVCGIDTFENVSKGVKLGAQIVAINGMPCIGIPFQEVKGRLNGHRPVEVTFRPRNLAKDKQDWDAQHIFDYHGVIAQLSAGFVDGNEALARVIMDMLVHHMYGQTDLNGKTGVFLHSNYHAGFQISRIDMREQFMSAKPFTMDDIKVDKRLWCLDKYGAWYICEIRKVKDDRMKLHFLGFKSKWNEYITVVDCLSKLKLI